MKICVITLHCTDNCGSSLQAYALQNYLISLGNDAELIDYCPRYLKYNGNFVKSLIKTVLFFKAVHSQNKKNADFRHKYLKLTERKYHTYQELEMNPPIADVFIAGSDQIWNPDYKCGLDVAYYLRFVTDETPKMSYAASIGKTDVPEEQVKWIAENSREFSFITVREETSKRLLENKVNCPVEYVCDPVLLLNKDDYLAIEEKPRRQEKYILIYLVQESELLEKLVAQLRAKLHAKVVLIYGVRNYCSCDDHIRDVSPLEFLGYIHHAEYIVTSSFHATVFSHIFQKQFAVVLPNANTARIEQMLQVTGLQDRIITKEDEIDHAFTPIDYQKVSPKLDAFIERSKNVIDQMLERRI